MAGRSKRVMPGGALIRRLAWVGGAVAVLSFAVEGGEYGTTDLLALRDSVADIESELALLRDTVAALDSTLKLVSSDDFTLERIAREEHGSTKIAVISGAREVGGVAAALVGRLSVFLSPLLVSLFLSPTHTLATLHVNTQVKEIPTKLNCTANSMTLSVVFPLFCHEKRTGEVERNEI